MKTESSDRYSKQIFYIPYCINTLIFYYRNNGDDCIKGGILNVLSTYITAYEYKRYRLTLWNPVFLYVPLTLKVSKKIVTRVAAFRPVARYLSHYEYGLRSRWNVASIKRNEIADYSTIKSYLGSNIRHYFTLSSNSEMCMKAVIRYISSDTQTEYISNAIVDLKRQWINKEIFKSNLATCIVYAGFICQCY